jgi:hypothetical protein
MLHKKVDDPLMYVAVADSFFYFRRDIDNIAFPF